MKKLGIGVLLLVVCFFLAGCGCEKEKFVVTFDTDGGSSVNSVEVAKDETVSAPTDPTKDGYTFDGWYLNDTKYNFDTKITADITLTAKWLKGEGQAMTISFNTDGGSSVGDIKVIEGQKIGELPVPTKDGYDFDGWYANGKKVTEDTVASKNMELTAKWSKQSESDNKPSDNNDNNSTAKYFTVSFNSNGGSKVKSQSVLSGKTASKPANPSRSGYTFAGWTLNGKTYNFSSKVTSNITLVASWTKNSTSTTSFTVTFNSNGGSSVKSQTVQSGKLITKPSDPTRDGYKFVGWYIGSTLVDFKSYKVSSNVTLTAKWEQVKYKIVLKEQSLQDDNGFGTASLQYTFEVYNGNTKFTDFNYFVLSGKRVFSNDDTIAAKYVNKNVKTVELYLPGSNTPVSATVEII